MGEANVVVTAIGDAGGRDWEPNQTTATKRWSLPNYSLPD
jgi:hypothetical protein